MKSTVVLVNSMKMLKSPAIDSVKEDWRLAINQARSETKKRAILEKKITQKKEKDDPKLAVLTKMEKDLGY